MALHLPPQADITEFKKIFASTSSPAPQKQPDESAPSVAIESSAAAQWTAGLGWEVLKDYLLCPHSDDEKAKLRAELEAKFRALEEAVAQAKAVTSDKIVRHTDIPLGGSDLGPSSLIYQENPDWTYLLQIERAVAERNLASLQRLHRFLGENQEILCDLLAIKKLVQELVDKGFPTSLQSLYKLRDFFYQDAHLLPDTPYSTRVLNSSAEKFRISFEVLSGFFLLLTQGWAATQSIYKALEQDIPSGVHDFFSDVMKHPVVTNSLWLFNALTLSVHLGCMVHAAYKLATVDGAFNRENFFEGLKLQLIKRQEPLIRCVKMLLITVALSLCTGPAGPIIFLALAAGGLVSDAWLSYKKYKMALQLPNPAFANQVKLREIKLFLPKLILTSALVILGLQVFGFTAVIAAFFASAVLAGVGLVMLCGKGYKLYQVSRYGKEYDYRGLFAPPVASRKRSSPSPVDGDIKWNGDVPSSQQVVLA